MMNQNKMEKAYKRVLEKDRVWIRVRVRLLENDRWREGGRSS